MMTSLLFIFAVGGVFSQSRKSFIEHNCLNHHPYGTFYYNKKNGRTGRHYYSGGQPKPPPRTTSALSNATAKCNGPTTPVQPRETAAASPASRPLPDEPIQMVGNHVGGDRQGNQNLMKLKKYEFGYDLEYEDR